MKIILGIQLIICFMEGKAFLSMSSMTQRQTVNRKHRVTRPLWRNTSVPAFMRWLAFASTSCSDVHTLGFVYTHTHTQYLLICTKPCTLPSSSNAIRADALMLSWRRKRKTWLRKGFWVPNWSAIWKVFALQRSWVGGVAVCTLGSLPCQAISESPEQGRSQNTGGKDACLMWLLYGPKYETWLAYQRKWVDNYPGPRHIW